VITFLFIILIIVIMDII